MLICPRLALLVLLLAPVGLPAQAVVIGVDGTDYDVAVHSNGVDVSHPGLNENAAALANTAISPGRGEGAAAPAFANAYAVPAVAVPEIDGFALGRVLFILLALGVWLRVRRRPIEHQKEIIVAAGGFGHAAINRPFWSYSG